MGLTTKLFELRRRREDEDQQIVSLWIGYIFYCLRLLYSLPSKRHYFKKVFPPKIFGKFIDIVQITSSFLAF